MARIIEKKPIAITVIFVATAVLTALLPKATHSGWLFLVVGLFWGAYLVGSLIGWGRLVARLLLPDRLTDWADRAAIGMASAVAFGGVLNLLHIISRPMILILLAVGFTSFFEDLLARRVELKDKTRTTILSWRQDLVCVVLATAVFVVAVFQLLGSVHGAINNVSLYRDFDVHDDYQAYMVFPVKMLEIGSMSPESFDARRMISLGGQPFLETLVLAGMPLRALHLFDGGVALFILIGLALALARDLSVPSRWRVALVLLLLFFPHLDARGNTTAVLTGAVMVFAWFRLVHSQRLAPLRWFRNAVLIALLAATLCALKPTFIPFTALFFAFTSLASLRDRETRWLALREALLAGALVFVFLFPWMLSMYESSKTLLYPVFGNGYFGSEYTIDFAAVKGDFSVPIWERLDIVRRNLLRIVPLFLLFPFIPTRSRRGAVASLVFAVATSITVVVMIDDPYLDRTLYRYAFPLLMTTYVAVLTAAFARPDDERRSFATLPAGLALCAALIPFTGFDLILASALRQPLKNVAGAISGQPLFEANSSEEIRTLQNAVPAGERIFARVAHPCLFDFKRNPISIHSLPGMASPPPGLPTFSGGEAVAVYLREQGFRYMAYGSISEPLRLLNLTDSDIKARYPRSRMRWVMLAYHRDLEKSLHELARNYRVVVRTEQSFVLDLSTHELATAPWRMLPQGVTGISSLGWTFGKATISGLGWQLSGGENLLAVELHGWHPWADDLNRLQPKITLDGQMATFRRTEGKVMLFAVSSATRRVGEITLTSATLPAQEANLAPGQPALGLDLAAIRIGLDSPAVTAPGPGPLQAVSGEVNPAIIHDKTNMLADNNWTTGDATLSGFHLPVPPDHRTLAIAIGPAHPFRSDVGRLALRVFVNGLELTFDKANGATLTYRLIAGITAVENIRIVTSTFVPKQLGINNDTRTLGVPIEWFATQP